MNEQAIAVLPTQSLMPAMAIEQAKERARLLKEFISLQMNEGTDYGVIPGTEKKDGEPGKKVLLKPGAEKLSTLFAIRPRFTDVQAVEDWTGADHGGEVFFYYRAKCSLWRGEDFICDADGSCNSMEKKYRYRQASRTCPVCKATAIIKGREEYGGGWLCYGKKGGCGAKFENGDAMIEGQEIGLVLNPDIADLTNTILKMAQKRALIAAILIAANASEYFTQDIEEDEEGDKRQPVKAERPMQSTGSKWPREMIETVAGMVEAKHDNEAINILNASPLKPGDKIEDVMRYIQMYLFHRWKSFPERIPAMEPKEASVKATADFVKKVPGAAG